MLQQEQGEAAAVTPPRQPSPRGAPLLGGSQQLVAWSHPITDHLLSLEENGSLTPNLLNLLFAALLAGAPNREIGAALVERVVTIKRPSALPVLLAAICHFPEHERRDRSKTQEQRDKLNNVYMDGLTLLDKLAAKSMDNLALCVTTQEILDQRWRLPCSLLATLPLVSNEQFLANALRLIQTLGSYSVCVRDIKQLLIALKREVDRGVSSRSIQYLKTLKDMTHRQGPNDFFHFDGQHSGIKAPPLEVWPSSGYTFSCWFRAEDFHDPKRTSDHSYEPRLLSLLSDTGSGFEVYFVANDLFMTVHHAGQASSMPLPFNHSFRNKAWYFITVRHVQHRWSSSEVQLFLNGKMVNNAVCKYPSVEGRAYAWIGTNMKIRTPYLNLPRSSCFYGQMGLIYLFKEALKDEDISNLYELGANYVIGREQKFDEEKGVSRSKLLFAFQPKATRDGICIDIAAALTPSAAMTRGGIATATSTSVPKGYHSTLLPGSTHFMTTHAIDAIHCSGGLILMLPLLERLIAQASRTSKVDVNRNVSFLISDLLLLISELLTRSGPTEQREWIAKGGFPIMSFLLQRAPVSLLDETVLQALNALILSLPSNRPDMLRLAYEHLFLNFDLWTRCEFTQQKNLMALIIQHAKKNPKRISKLFPWQAILDVLRQCYTIPVVDASVPGSQAAHEETKELRGYLIEVMRLTTIKGVPQGHMESLVKFLNDRVESLQLQDILGLLAFMISQTINAPQQVYQNLHKMLDECGGLLALAGLLGREDEEIKRKVLLLFTSLMQWTSSPNSSSYGKQLRKKLESQFFSNQCSFIAHHLSPYPLTAPMYSALFAFLVEDANFTELDGSQKIKNKQILPVIFALLPSADIFLQQQILQDFNVLLSISEEARECFLSQWGWQKWMINVMIPLVIRSERREWQRMREIEERKKQQALAAATSPNSRSSNREKLRGRSSSLPPTLANISNSLSSLSSTISSSFSFLPSFSPNSSLTSLPSATLPVVASTSPSSPREEEAIKELVLKLTDLLLSGIMDKPNGWKEVEQMRLWLQLLCVGGRMRNSIQRSIYSHILGNIKNLVTKRGYANMNPFNGGLGQPAKSADGQTNPPALTPASTKADPPTKERSSWWSGFTAKIEKKEAKKERENEKEGDLASPFLQNFVHIAAMCEEFLIQDMRKERQEEDEEEALMADMEEEVDEESLKKKRKHQKSQLMADFGLMEQILHIFDCVFWDQLLLSQATKQHLFHIKTRRFLHVITQITLLVIDRANLVLGTDRQKKSASRMTEFQEMVTDSKQKDPLIAEMSDYLNYFLVQKKEQHKIKTNAMRMVLLENVQRLRLLFPYVLQGKPTSYSPERLMWVMHHLLKAMRRAIRDDGNVGWDPTWDGIAQIVRDLLRENLSIIANTLPLNVSLPADLSCLEQNESPERFVAYIEEMNSNFELLEIMTAAQIGIEEEDASEQALEARMKKGIASLQQATEREREANSIHEARLRKDIEELQLAHTTSEFHRHSTKAIAINSQKRMIEHLWKKLRHGELTNERSPWSEEQKKRAYWKLDMVEDSLRRRMRMVIDDEGSNENEASWELRIQRRAQIGASPTKFNSPQDDAVGEEKLFQNLLSQLKVNASINFEDVGSIQQDEETAELDVTSSTEEYPASNPQIDGSAEPAKEEAEWVVMETKPAYIGLELEHEEAVIFSTDCQMVRPLQVIDGRVDITKAHIYFFIRDRAVQERGVRDRKWHIAHVDAVHRRRYLLRWNALEIFFKNRKNYMFQFPSDKTRKKVFDTLVSAVKSTGRNIPHNRFTSAHPHDIMQKSGYTQAWVERRISNFEYLMHCNSIAGRTYNDLTQYPVFPWVLADYQSTTIDLNDPAVYRDLSKPIGALEPGRLQRFIERYELFDDPQVPKFHYGSHYSSVGSVLYYLLRLPPFSRHAIKLQGGTFDHPDRQFHSIAQTWTNVLTDFSDVKELTPEFFYLPEFLKNSCSFDLGIMQSGHKVDDVILPPWASSPEEFIRIQREALESDYVSQNLHHWIDLIFGYKQRGPAAVASHNLFYFLTYEGAVDLDSIKSDFEREAVEVQIANFGQTPSQLFHSPHPSRNPPGYIFHPSDLKPFVRTTLSFSPPQAMLALNNSFFTICARGETYSRRWMPEGNGQGLPFNFETSANWSCGLEPPFAIINNENDSASGGRAPTAYALACVQKDNAFCLLHNSSIVQTFREHRGDITCFASSKNVVVSGSKDTCVIVWNVIAHATTKRIDPTPRHILRSHDEEVTCVAVGEDLDLVISGSKDGTCVLHALFSGKYLRTIRCGDAVERLGLSSRGEIVICTANDILLYSINGTLLAQCPCEDKLTYMQIVPSASMDGPGRERFLITSGQYIVFRRFDDLTPIHKLDYNLRTEHMPPSPVTAFSLVTFPPIDDTRRSDSISTSGVLFVGLLSGELLIYAVDHSGLLRGLEDSADLDDEYEVEHSGSDELPRELVNELG